MKFFLCKYIEVRERYKRIKKRNIDEKKSKKKKNNKNLNWSNYLSFFVYKNHGTFKINVSLKLLLLDDKISFLIY